MNKIIVTGVATPQMEMSSHEMHARSHTTVRILYSKVVFRQARSFPLAETGHHFLFGCRQFSYACAWAQYLDKTRPDGKPVCRIMNIVLPILIVRERTKFDECKIRQQKFEFRFSFNAWFLSIASDRSPEMTANTTPPAVCHSCEFLTSTKAQCHKDRA